MSDGTWCPQCGPRVTIDEDSCCASCGATAVGDGAGRALAVQSRLATVEAAANTLRSKWAEGGCITEPPCGACAWCDFVKALDGSEGGG